MDFLRDVKNKLQELEELSKMTEEQQQMQIRELFTGKKKKGQAAPKRPQQLPPQKREKVKRVRQPVDSSGCPVGEVSDGNTGGSSGPAVPSIFANLGERLDEAFLLQEILGEPRCVRGWDDD